jgi:hypothetical protein
MSIDIQADGTALKLGIYWPAQCPGCGAPFKQAWADTDGFICRAEYDCGSKRIGWKGPTETACVRLCLASGGCRR